jgi:hypothetical protein
VLRRWVEITTATDPHGTPVIFGLHYYDEGRCGLKVPAWHGGQTCDQRVQILALFLLPLSQAYSRAPAVLVDELDAGGFERPAHRQIIGRGHRRLVL